MYLVDRLKNILDPLSSKELYSCAQQKMSEVVLKNASKTVLFLGLLALTPSSLLALSGYVTNSAGTTVSIIDLTSNTVTGTIAVGSNPLGIAISGNRAYVANSGSDTVSVIDLTTNTVTATIDVGSNPYFVAIGGNYAYVSNYEGGSGSGSLSVIDINTNTVTATITDDSFYGPLALIASGTKLYVPNWGDDGHQGTGNTVSVVNTLTNTVVDVVTVGTAPAAVAVSGNYAYVANNSNPGSVSVIRTTDDSLYATITDGDNLNYPGDIIINGNTAYVTNNGFNTISVINLNTNTVVDTVVVGASSSGPYGIAMNGNTLYITNDNNTISYINSANLGGGFSLVSDPDSTFNEVSWIAISSSASGLYDIERLRLIYEAQVSDAQMKLSDAGL